MEYCEESIYTNKLGWFKKMKMILNLMTFIKDQTNVLSYVPLEITKLLYETFFNGSLGEISMRYI